MCLLFFDSLKYVLMLNLLQNHHSTVKDDTYGSSNFMHKEIFIPGLDQQTEPDRNRDLSKTFV